MDEIKLKKKDRFKNMWSCLRKNWIRVSSGKGYPNIKYIFLTYFLTMRQLLIFALFQFHRAPLHVNLLTLLFIYLALNPKIYKPLKFHQISMTTCFHFQTNQQEIKLFSNKPPKSHIATHFYKQPQQNYRGPKSEKMKVIGKYDQDISLGDLEMTTQERRQFIIKWRDFTSLEKMTFIHKELHSVIVTLILRKILNQQKLSHILDLKLTLNEAMSLNLTNYYSYIMELIRKNTTNTARSYLNQLTEHINRYEDLLHKNIEKEVKRYRKLKNNNSDESESESSAAENLREKMKRQKAKAKHRQRRDGLLLHQTYISGGKLIRKEEIVCVQPDSAFTPFTRITKQAK